jgi:alkaline phosphatase
MINRRGFLRGSSTLAAAAATVAFPNISRAADKTVSGKPGQKPRRIIHMVSDGMSAGTLTCAEHLSQIVRGRGTSWMSLFNNPAARSGLMNTRSLNSLVTDSSAASSAWGSGVRIINGVVNQAGDGTPLKHLYEILANERWTRGLVTTTEITHATPAGFASCTSSRDKATEIASQYLKGKVDLLLGGGAKFFDKTYRLDKRDLLKEFRDAGYAVMDKPAELAVAPTNKRWLGLFARSHLPYTVDHVRDPKLLSNVPTLATMTAAALRRLEGESRFILQVEGGRVDHGCHNNDAAAALYDQIAFDEAIDVALEYQKRDPETLIVITTDHGNGNLALNGSGDAYGQSTWQFRNLRDVKQSFATMLKPLKRQVEEPEIEKDDAADKKKEDAKSAAQKEREKTEKKIKEENVATPTEIIQIVEAGTGYKMPYRKAELLRLCLMNTGEAIYDMRKSDTAALGDVMANYLAVGFTGTAHTGDFVQVTAIGPGAERFGGYIQNTDIFGHYLDFAGVDFRNPQEPLIEARGHEASDVENIGRYAQV